MTININEKVIKRVIIGGVVYLVADFCYQWGKGKTLRVQLNKNADAKEIYDMLKTEYNSAWEPMQKMRLKIIKTSADLKG